MAGSLMRCWVLWLVVLGLGVCGCRSSTDPASPTPPNKVTVRIAAAADLKFALEEVLQEFQKQSPNIETQATYGSSGSLFAQLSNQGPFDMFLSADIEYPKKLIESGIAIRESEFTYSIGHIVLWSRKESPIDVQRGIQALSDPSVRKIAIANPKHAPYGRAAEAALKHFGLYDSVQDKLVLGENVAQTAQFIESGAADIGIIALSVAMSTPLRDRGSYWRIPDDSHLKLVQGGVIMKATPHRNACEKLRALLISDAGQKILGQYGFESAGKD